HGAPGLTLLPCRVVAHGRATVPGADVLTDIAPIHMMTDCGGACSRQIAAMLDRQVRQTPPRVELIGLDDGAGRTGLDAGRARAAPIGDRDVGLERQVRDALAEEEPRPQPLIDETRVLADPAESGPCRDRLLGDRPGVHVTA